MHRLANIISLVFDPIIVSIFTLILIIVDAERDVTAAAGWFSLIVVVGLLPPLIFLIYEKKRGKVTDWFLYNRAERIPIYIASLISLSLALLLIWVLEGPKTLQVFSLMSLLNSLVLGMATYLGHKPSVHASATTFFVLVVLLLEGFEWWPLLLLMPIVAWSRFKMKKHTWPQLSAGMFITIFVVLITLKFFDFTFFK